MAPHSSTLAWKIPWMEEPGRLQSMGSLRLGHDWATSLPLSHIGEGNGSPLQYSCLENPRDREAWWAAIYGVAQSRTWLKRLSSSSSRENYWSLYKKNIFGAWFLLNKTEWAHPYGSVICVFHSIICVDPRGIEKLNILKGAWGREKEERKLGSVHSTD